MKLNFLNLFSANTQRGKTARSSKSQNSKNEKEKRFKTRIRRFEQRLSVHRRPEFFKSDYDISVEKETRKGRKTVDHRSAKHASKAIVDGHHPEGDREGSQISELQHQGKDDQRKASGHSVHESSPAESDALAEGRQRNGLESQKAHQRNAGLFFKHSASNLED